VVSDLEIEHEESEQLGLSPKALAAGEIHEHVRYEKTQASLAHQNLLALDSIMASEQ
jgi:hypothetical protein